jgi:phenylacetate-coenzyme A ligase PaaK-like adenylate-forming protein
MGLTDTLATCLQGWDLWRGPHRSHATFRAHQQTRLAALVAVARAHSPYYAALYRGLPRHGVPLAALPPVSKADLMAHFDAWVTDPTITRARVEAFVAGPARIGAPFLERYLVWTSSGSTGEPALLVQDRQAVQLLAASTLLRGYLAWRPLPALLHESARPAGIFATGGHFFAAAMLHQQGHSRSRSTPRVGAFSILTPLPDLVQALNQFQPTLLITYPSMLALLASEQGAGRLHLHPNVLATAGETLVPPVRAQIERAFARRVSDCYGCSEAGWIAFGCREGWQHVNADCVLLEPVDAHYQPTPVGQPSQTVLLTNLVNPVQPLIRYDLGDSITVRPNRCPCGSRLPAIRVAGRRDDTLALPHRTGGTLRIVPLALATVVEETPGVRRWQVLQRTPQHLNLRLEVVAGADRAQVWAEVERRVRDYLAVQGSAPVDVRLDDAPPAADPVSGKYRQVRVQLER